MVSVVQSPFTISPYWHTCALCNYFIVVNCLFNLEGANEKVLEEVSETTEQETGFRGKLFLSSLFHLFFFNEMWLYRMYVSNKWGYDDFHQKKNILQSLQPTTDHIRTVMGNWEGSRND